MTGLQRVLLAGAGVVGIGLGVRSLEGNPTLNQSKTANGIISVVENYCPQIHYPGVDESEFSTLDAPCDSEELRTAYGAALSEEDFGEGEFLKQLGYVVDFVVDISPIGLGLLTIVCAVNNDFPTFKKSEDPDENLVPEADSVTV